MLTIYRKFALIVVITICISGCGNAKQDEAVAIINAESVTTEKDNNEYLPNSESINESRDESSDENPINDSENNVIEYVNEISAIAYYQDFYLPGKYLIIESDGVTFYISLDGYSSIEKIKYDDVVRVNINYIDNLGFIEITDKAGGSLSFVFESGEAKEADQLIDNYR